jgi:hypothetical protein
MKNGTSDHDESVAEHLRRRNVALDMLQRHLAHVEATLMALTVKNLSGENLCTAKGI